MERRVNGTHNRPKIAKGIPSLCDHFIITAIAWKRLLTMVHMHLSVRLISFDNTLRFFTFWISVVIIQSSLHTVLTEDMHTL